MPNKSSRKNKLLLGLQVKIVCIAGVALCLSVGLRGSVVSACGGCSVRPNSGYTSNNEPEPALLQFMNGNMGIIYPSWYHKYLFVAYRFLSNSPLSKTEQERLIAPSKNSNDKLESAIHKWITARNAAFTSTTVKRNGIETFRYDSPGGYWGYLNCHRDAFITAAQTLKHRLNIYDKDTLAKWIQVQDAVFANCEKNIILPEVDISTNASPLFKADLAYQIAASHFYSGSFNEAVIRFDKLAQDTSSPWQQFGEYLSVRALVRKAGLTSACANQYGCHDKAILKQAKLRAQKILNNENLNKRHAATKRLLDLIHMRLNAVSHLPSLAQRFANGSDEKETARILSDLILSYERAVNDQDLFNEMKRNSDMIDWVQAFRQFDYHSDCKQTDCKQNFEHAFTNWINSDKKSLPWLTLSLLWVPKDEPKFESLFNTAIKLETNSPAYLSARYYLIGYLLRMNDFERAKRVYQQTDYATAPKVAQYFLKGLGVVFADNFEQWLQKAIYTKPVQNECSGNALMFSNTRSILQFEMPLSMQFKALSHGNMPAELKTSISTFVLSQAAVLGNAKILSRATQKADTLFEPIASILKNAGKKSVFQQRFEIVFSILRGDISNSGIRSRKTTRLASQNEKLYFPRNNSSPFDIEYLPLGQYIHPRFLTKAQTTQLKKEMQQHSDIGPFPIGVGKIVLRFAKRFPNDERVPEALALFVETTRYASIHSMGGPKMGQYSKRAFQLLHEQYEDSKWAKQTRFWYQ